MNTKSYRLQNAQKKFVYHVRRDERLGETYLDGQSCDDFGVADAGATVLSIYVPFGIMGGLETVMRYTAPAKRYI